MVPPPELADLPGELPVALLTIGHDGLVDYANPRLRELLGGGDASGRPVDDVLGSVGAYARLAELSHTGHEELRCQRADGTSLWLLPAVRRSGEQLVVTLSDVTARHQAEAEHADQAATLTLIADFPQKNPGPVSRIAQDGTVLMANQAARSFFGSDEIDGKCWVDLCPGMTWQIWEQVLATDPGSERLTHEAERDGTCVMFTHVRSDTGDLVFVYGADITTLRRQERLLAEQTAALAEVARFPEMNPGPVVRLDTRAEVLLANAAARAVFGSELIGRCWTDLCPGVDDATWQQVLAGSEVLPVETRIGDHAYVFSHRFDPRSELVFVYGADVTRQKQAERALAQSERMATLGTLAAGVAHELNNPAAATRRAADQLRDAFEALEAAHLQLDGLGSVPEGLALLRALDRQAVGRAREPGDLTTVERSDRESEVEDWLDGHDVDDGWDLAPTLVAQGLEPADLDRLAGVFDGNQLPAVLSWTANAFRVHRLAHEIAQGSARISEIVGALKSYSYLGQAPVQAVDVHQGLDSTLVILRNKLKAGVDVRRDYAEGLPLVAAYGSELNQVWTNLIDNAADAMGGRGDLTITTRREGSWVVVDVVDDGPGIAEAVLPHVFDPFYTTKEPGKGTGLGLSTTYSIVTEKHGGRIDVTSRPGRTCFTVRLPVDGPAGPASTASESETS